MRIEEAIDIVCNSGSQPYDVFALSYHLAMPNEAVEKVG